jgi:tetratricopeptide (TPR) repeat protein
MAHPGLHHDIERVTTAMKTADDKAALLVERGYYLRLEGDLTASLRDLDEAIRLDPEANACYAQRGLTLTELERFKQAEADFDRFIGAGGLSSPVLLARARIRASDGKVTAALADYDKAIEIDLDVDAVLERARFLELQGKLDRAAQGLRDAIPQLGGAVILSDALIRVEMARKRFAEAILLIDQQLATAPVRTGLLLRRADVHEQAGRTKQAKEDREQALIEADKVLARRATGIHLLSRARAYIALGRPEEAKRDLERVVQKSPKFLEAKNLLAEIKRGESGRTIASTVGELSNDR